MGENGAVCNYAPYSKCVLQFLPCLPLGRGVVGNGLRNAKMDYHTLPYLRVLVDQRFSQGLHKRVGDVVKSDYAVTSEMIRELLTAAGLGMGSEHQQPGEETDNRYGPHADSRIFVWS
jgi:hypothetical protein